LSLMALAKPGDEILVEEFTYPGITGPRRHPPPSAADRRTRS
jgi:hypothetical protein